MARRIGYVRKGGERKLVKEGRDEMGGGMKAGKLRIEFVMRV